LVLSLFLPWKIFVEHLDCGELSRTWRQLIVLVGIGRRAALLAMLQALAACARAFNVLPSLLVW
jgi:hypothetical protein